MSRKRRIETLLLASVFVVGFAASAFATTRTSSWYRFFGPTSVGGNTQCADQQAAIDDTYEWGRGGIRARFGATCGNANVRPASHLGTLQYVIRNSNGAICGFLDWAYNGAPTSEMYAYASWNGPNGTCPSSVQYYGRSKGKYFRIDIGDYVTSGTWSISPVLQLT